MADIYKTKEIETNINERGVNLGNVDVTLYTMDKGSAAFKVYLKREVKYGNEKVYDSVNLYTTDMTPRIDIVAADGSTFAYEPVDVVIPESGVIQYIVSDYVIRHAGKMDVYIYLENKSESVQVANFYFYIEEDGVARRLGKEITGGRLEDVVKNVMSGQLMELLSEDFREQLEREIKSFLQDHNKDFNLRFEDLTREEKDELMKNLTNQGLADFRIEDNSILNEKLVDGTIQPEKTSFFDFNYSNNLLDLSKVLEDTSVDSSANVIAEESRWLTDYIPLDASKGEKLNITEGSYRVGTYDENKEPIILKGITKDNKLVIENTSATRYVRVSGTKDLSEVMINKGDALLPYEKPIQKGDIKLKDEYYNQYEIKKDDIKTDFIEDKAITPEKTTFFDIKKSSNLLDINKVTYNKNINNDGNIENDDNRWISDFIPMTPNESLSFTKGSFAVALYDEDKNFISRVGMNISPYSPRSVSNLGFIRVISSSDLSNLMFNKGESLLPYEEPYGEDIKLKDSYYNTFDFKDSSVTTDKIKDAAITPEKTTFITSKESNNLLSKIEIQPNKSIDTDGTVVDDSERWLSDYIAVDGTVGEKLNITADRYRLALYDKDKKFINRVGFTGITQYAPSATTGTKFVRIIGYMTNDYTKIMVNKGETLLPYEKISSGANLKLQSDVKVDIESLPLLKKSENIFNKNEVQFSKKIDINGNIVDEQNWVVTPKIAVKGKTVSFTQDMTVIWAVFDENDNLISRSQKNNGATTTLDLSDNASYFILSVAKTTLDRFMANYGSTLLPYEEYGYTLVSTDKMPIKISKDIVPIQNGSETVVQGGTIVDLENSKQISNEVSEVYLSNEKRNIYSTTKTSQLDYVEISTNSVDAEIVLSYSDEENNTVLANTSVPGELEELPLTLQNIVEYGYPNVEYLYYDPKKASYKIALKNLNFSNGFELSIRNSGASTINITTKIVGRYYV
ncbi:BppU family phage baseplate upper protein [Staphylococcus hominis]|uniref:BppU family phage baseplate upper protein n=1 Tax=Staphylococcus hominis TaxID=1290 RepID=UPI0031BBBDB7